MIYIYLSFVSLSPCALPIGCKFVKIIKKNERKPGCFFVCFLNLDVFFVCFLNLDVCFGSRGIGSSTIFCTVSDDWELYLMIRNDI